MNLWERWLRRPQGVWLRRAIFQIHLWSGIGFRLYVLVISVTGSAIVFRNELYGKASKGPMIVEPNGPRLSREQLDAAARRAYPGHAITYYWEAKNNPNQAVEIWLERNGSKAQRLFDPYTGKDIGASVPWLIRTVAKFSDLHLNLMAGETGRKVNGWAAGLFTLVAMTGFVVWWPGIANWKRSATLHRKVGWKRLNWDLHSAFGLWTFAFVFVWGVTGVYVVFPEPFQRAVNHFYPLDYYRLPTDAVLVPAADAPVQFRTVADSAPANPEPPRPRRRPQPRLSTGDKILRWFYYLHFGNFGGWPVKALWVILGFAPVLLFVTGTIMWWNRVIVAALRRLRSREAEAVTPVA